MDERLAGSDWPVGVPGGTISKFGQWPSSMVAAKRTSRSQSLPANLSSIYGYMVQPCSDRNGLSVPNLSELHGTCPRLAKCRLIPHSNSAIKPSCHLSYPLQSVEDLRLWFQALDNINLEIRRGEIFCAARPNGAGKTTLISIVCRHRNPTSERIVAATTSSNPIAPRARVIVWSAGTTHRRFRDGVGDRQLSRACSQPKSQLISKGAEGPVAVGQEGRQDRHAVRRHEAPVDDRESAVARTADFCFSTSRPRASMSNCARACGK